LHRIIFQQFLQEEINSRGVSHIDSCLYWRKRSNQFHFRVLSYNSKES